MGPRAGYAPPPFLVGREKTASSGGARVNFGRVPDAEWMEGKIFEAVLKRCVGE